MVKQTVIDEFNEQYPHVQLIAVTKYTDVSGVAASVASSKVFVYK
jgi:uncharacterized pyridoxal phosphate-containing UPF0001 family protein